MNKKSRSPFFLIVTGFALFLSACGSPQAPQPTVDVSELVNQIAATLQAGYTQTALAMPTTTFTPEPTVTPLPSNTSEPLVVATSTLAPTATLSGPTPLPVNPATANGCYNAALVADVSVPAGTNYKAGAKFTKTWRLINTGTCDWTSDFKITYVGGNLFGSDTTKIRQRVPVGGIADISLDMEAPSGTSGTVVSNWQMATDTGSLFGPVLTVSIVLPGSNPTATSLACYNATLVSSVRDPGGKLNPGEKFHQTWQIKNSGDCDWTSDFKIEFVGGNAFGSDTTKIRQRVESGATTDPISLTMFAPGSAGTYTSSWQMSNEDGVLFGPVFTFEVVVK